MSEPRTLKSFSPDPDENYFMQFGKNTFGEHYVIKTSANYTVGIKSGRRFANIPDEFKLRYSLLSKDKGITKFRVDRSHKDIELKTLIDYFNFIYSI